MNSINKIEQVITDIENYLATSKNRLFSSTDVIVNREEMEELVNSGIIEIEQACGGKLAGKSFCFTGELSMKRADAEKLVKDNGGSIKSSVTKDLSYLVTNDTTSGSSKNVKAAKLGIPVIDEKEFLKLLGN